MSGTSTPEPVELLADDRNRLRRLVVVDRDAHELGAGVRELGDLDGGAVGIGGVGVRHRLDDDRVARTRPARRRRGRSPTDGGAGWSSILMVERVSAIGTRRARRRHAWRSAIAIEAPDGPAGLDRRGRAGGRRPGRRAVPRRGRGADRLPSAAAVPRRPARRSSAGGGGPRLAPRARAQRRPLPGHPAPLPDAAGRVLDREPARRCCRR